MDASDGDLLSLSSTLPHPHYVNPDELKASAKNGSSRLQRA